VLPPAGSPRAHIIVSIAMPRAAMSHFEVLGTVLARTAAPARMASLPTGSHGLSLAP
jgi:hypothetical protein